jgi:hypothetical protein
MLSSKSVCHSANMCSVKQKKPYSCLCWRVEFPLGSTVTRLKLCASLCLFVKSSLCTHTRITGLVRKQANAMNPRSMLILKDPSCKMVPPKEKMFMTRIGAHGDGSSCAHASTAGSR